MGRDSVKSKAGRKKGKPGSRWAKGQSCVSNPEVKKFREEASSFYYHQVKPNPLLTASNVEGGLKNEDIDDDVLSEDIQSLTVSDGRSLGLTSCASYNSFASDWSKCSNKAFERFLSKFKLDSALHKDMLSILAATSEIINSLGGTHKETEYFASFITALEKCEPQQYQAMLALVSIVVGKIPETVLRRKFNDFYPKIGSILEEAMDSQDSALIRMCCDILRKCIAVQDPKWLETERPVQSLVYSILKCATYENPKVRKKARKAIGFIMDQQSEKNGEAATYLVVGWILDQLSSYPTCGAKTVVDSLSLLQNIWPNIKNVPSTGAKKLFEAILRVMSSGDISILKIGFLFFSTLFQTSGIRFTTSESSNNFAVEGLNAKLVTALWEFKPNWRSEEIFISWLHCILNSLVKLSFENPEISQQYIPLIFEAVSLTWSTTFGRDASKELTDFLPHLITPEIPIGLIEKSFQIISKNLIILPPNENCLFVLSKILESLTPSAFCGSAKEVLLQLIPLRSTPRVENIIGLFIAAFGIENIWTSVDAEIDRSIILPLLRNNISNENFLFWKNNILSLLTLGSSDASIKFLVWDSFVGFCKNPSEPTNFPAELLGKTIAECSEIRLSTLAALRQILKWPQMKPVATKYSKNYIPILFNLYVKEKSLALSKKAEDSVNNGHAEAIGTTICEYLPFCDKSFISELTEKALKKYSEATNEVEKSPILDLLGFLTSMEQDESTLEKLFNVVQVLINSPGQMKRAYRQFVLLLQSEHVSASLKSKIADLVRANKGKTKSNAEPFRLECLTYLALQNNDWFTEFVPEAILNLLSVNMKARKVAVKFVTTLIQNLQAKGSTMEQVMNIINLGLKSSNAFTCACTIHFLTLVYRTMNSGSPIPSVVNQCIEFILQKKESTVSSEAFRFLSLNLSLHKGAMGPYAAGIGKAIAQGELPRKETNKMLARLVKTFGIVGLKVILPNLNDPKMHRRIKNIQKKLRKLKDTKRQEVESKEEKDVSDDEGYTDEVLDSWTRNSRNANTSEKLLMKEDLVDFLDPHNMTTSFISKPKEAKKKDQFELSSDGKLIIQDESSKKKKGSIDIESDEDEYSELFKKPETSRKRKLNSGASTASSKRSMKSYASSRGSSRSMKGSTRSTKSYASFKEKPDVSSNKRRKIAKSNASSRGRVFKY